MVENQIAIKEDIEELFNLYKEIMPDVAEAYNPLPEEVYKEGVLPAKMKRLMALNGALVHGCRGCILHQVFQALELGATAEEILEACAVAISLGGTMAAAETTRVVKYLKDMGKI